MKALTTKDIREIETFLSSTLFFGIPLGATLNDTWFIYFCNGEGHWNWKTRIINTIRMVQYWLYPLRPKRQSITLSCDHILVAWLSGTPRLTGLMQPVIEFLKEDSCLVLCGDSSVVPLIPEGVSCISEDQLWDYSVKEWRAEYRKCEVQWSVQLKMLCQKYEFPGIVFEQLILTLMIASQKIAGCISYLKKARPSVIVTDFDRNNKWSCLVLAARMLRIPTITLVHGGIEKDAKWYSPVLADKIVCWGEMDRQKLLSAGEPAEKIIIGGCPRFSRDTPAVADNNVMKASLNQQKPVVLFGSNIDRQNYELVESFCIAVENMEYLVGAVRLHPSEKLASYGAMIERHPQVIFFENRVATMDESIALADVVVVHGSTVGSEALIKRASVVVFDFDAQPSGLDYDFVNIAGCPHAKTPDELVVVLRRILQDESFRRDLELKAESYVKNICSIYGKESARFTANIIRDVVKK